MWFRRVSMDNQKGVNIELIKGTLDDYIIKDKDKIVIGRFTITELDKENKKCNLKLKFYREDNYDLLKITLEAILKAVFKNNNIFKERYYLTWTTATVTLPANPTTKCIGNS